MDNKKIYKVCTTLSIIVGALGVVGAIGGLEAETIDLLEFARQMWLCVLLLLHSHTLYRYYALRYDVGEILENLETKKSA